MLKVSEIFSSIQGEGRFVGVPSVFLRTFGCSLTCPGFGMPRGEATQEIENVINILPSIEKFEDLPLVSTGCDSYASWHPKFKHLSPKLSNDELEERINALIPGGEWTGSGQEFHLVFTGGEPLMAGWQKFYIDLLTRFVEKGLRDITFETNGTRAVSDELIAYLNSEPRLHVTWSVSPKLTVSGHATEETLFPEVLQSFNKVNNSYLYCKYVVRDLVDMDEVKLFQDSYKAAGVTVNSVYLMPEGGVVNERQTLTERVVADLAIEKGYRYTPRLHLNIYGNVWAK